MIFLKLGGSLITDKSGYEVARPDVIERIADEIAGVYLDQPSMKLLIGHGSGSFGHRAAEKFNTHKGALTQEDWRGFLEVGAAAARLHSIIIDSLLHVGLPVLSFPPSKMLTTRDGEIESYAIAPIEHCMDRGLLPVIHGDVAFDSERGSTIVSTEALMRYLTRHFKPERILLAGKAAGIQDDQGKTLPIISQEELESLSFHDPEGADVTGGMKSKVLIALEMAANEPRPEVTIFSAAEPGALKDVLLGGLAGTRITGP